MANAELVRTLDFILRRCDEQEINVVAEAVVRRRRELTMFGGSAKLPDPKKLAREISGSVNMGANLANMRKIVQEMAVQIIKREAPELNDEQIASLTAAWIPPAGKSSQPLPGSLLADMINQFVRFSRGEMEEAEEKKLRTEMPSWPERYWKAFPEVIQLLIKDFLNGEFDEKDFYSRMAGALALKS